MPHFVFEFIGQRSTTHLLPTPHLPYLCSQFPRLICLAHAALLFYLKRHVVNDLHHRMAYLLRFCGYSGDRILLLLPNTGDLDLIL